LTILATILDMKLEMFPTFGNIMHT